MCFNVLKKKFIRKLIKENIKLCLAESITGGTLAAELIKTPGASNFLEYSLVCYGTQSKITFLGIDKEIKKYGIISNQVSKSMVKKITKYSKSQNKLALSCTGLAGPHSENMDELSGTVFISTKYMKKIKTLKKFYPNKKRNEIIRLTF